MNQRSFRLLSGKLSSGENVTVFGLPGASKALFLKELCRKLPKFFVIVPTHSLGVAITEDLKRVGVSAVFVPPWDSPPFDLSPPSSASQHRRLKALYRLLADSWSVVVLTPSSFLQKVQSPEFLLDRVLEFRRGAKVDYSLIPLKLTEGGYRRVDAEPEEGEFLLKGDTLEVVSPEGERLVVELFGSEVERLSVNRREVQEAFVVPVLEVPVGDALERVDEELAEKHRLLGDLSGADRLLSAVVPLVPLTAYTGELPLVAVEAEQVRSAGASFLRQVKENHRVLTEQGFKAVHWRELLFDADISPVVSITDRRVSGGVDFGVHPLPWLSRENAGELLSAFESSQVVAVCTTERAKEEVERQALKRALKVTFYQGASCGSFKNEGVLWLAEGQELSLAVKEEDVTAFEPGTPVVHRDYGVGIFKGVVSRRIAGRTYDFVEIEYAEGERLYAPFTQIDRIYRYTYPGVPSLDRLGGTSWRNLQRKVKASLVRFAKQLAELYRERKTVKGYSLVGDRSLLEAFEKKFPYRLTPDQERTLKEVYRDMESDKPMDRLVCGDVGFGKTEIAMRAAMKAVSAGKQVALVAPTTVLVDQHFRTFKDRFDGFPVKVEMLSRFRSRKEQEEVLEGLKSGTVDIVIGTHRLLREDVEFKDLGLLIIDEEHRFGVRAKEKLTQLKRNIDVLYLSATPIPRTLYSALSGFRDISLIETPPPGRRGVKVVVEKYSDSLLLKAVGRELRRGGQVFVVENDIDKLPALKGRLESAFPCAKVELVHGRMKPEKIERVMHEFFEGGVSVLVSTSIVESGLDIPSANTLIVIGAERFGLSQLYQLRGRVGRGVDKGYCYLLYSGNCLTPEAVKRLEAMKELSPLGGGFRLALKDLELRGAGTLLGPKQSGFVKTLGLDLYLKLLQEVTHREEEDVKVEVPVEAYIPEDYIEDTKERLRIYSMLSTAKDLTALMKKVEEIHGALPDPLVNMFEIMRVKALAKRLGVREVMLSPSGGAVLKFGGSPAVSPERLVEVLRERGASFTPDGRLSAKVNGLKGLVEFLGELAGGVSVE